MAHFAQLDQDNRVLQVIVVNGSVMDTEAEGIAFCQSLFGAETSWVQTSYNGLFRQVYAGIGYRYDAELDAFLPPDLHEP